MTINSITNLPETLAAQTDLATSVAPTPPTDGTNPQSNVSMSERAKVFGELQSLAQSDPAKFKQVMSNIADQLSQEASQVGGQKGEFLSTLASKFKQAVSDGNLSALQPPGNTGGAKAYGHHGHHHGGGDKAANGQDDILSIVSNALNGTTTTSRG